VSTRTTEPSVGFLPVVVAALGVVLLGYGASAFSAAPLAGVWLAAAGLCLLLSGVVATPLVAGQFGLTTAQQRNAALVLGGVGALLLVAFLAVNVASFGAGSGSG